jgi:CBS-domain-containing membrane protein
MDRENTWWWRGLSCIVILAVSGAIGLALRQPWLFPSLGPTVILMLESPTDPSARLENTLVGHLVAVVVGLGSLVLCGLYGQPSAPTAGLSPRYVIAGVLSVTVTMLVLMALHRPHPPAGATTLLVSLGILTTPSQLLSVVGAVVVVAVLCWLASRRERRDAQPAPTQPQGSARGPH